MRLPAEVFNKKHKRIRIRIGSPVTVKEQEGFTDISTFRTASSGPDPVLARPWK
ncbi:MAG: hypothetical protein R2751_19270 [Bacteroidales bacterium]